uniref:Uncharacterized protein n=1 Tax=Solanum lycopersicum TaxID=4081 RepID=A0A3Q7IA12_SOLLC
MLSLQTDLRQYNQQQQLLISRVPPDGVAVGDQKIDSSFPFQSESALSSGNINSELSREGSKEHSNGCEIIKRVGNRIGKMHELKHQNR